MAQWRDFPLPDGSYSDETRPWSQQDVVNYLPTIAERNGTRSPVLHKTVPGMKAFAQIGDGPHRGAHNCEGRRFIVSGRKLYQVTPAGGATDLGTIPGTIRVTMAHNQIANGNQVLIGTVDNGYLWDTTTSALTPIGVSLQSVDFLNQRFLGVDQQRRFWRHSALADGASWSDLDVYSSESSPDRIVGLKVLDGQVYVFNERTIEVFVDQPTETQVYQRSVVIQRGCISGDSIVRIAGTLFFVGDDYIPYRLDGYTPVPVGTKPITSDLSGTDPRKIFGFGWEDRGYLVYYITAQNGHTWGYDVTNGRWHRRESYGLGRWRINTLVKFERDWYAGDYASGLMYRLEWGYVYEGCEIMPRKLRSGVLHNAGNRVRIHGFRLFAETGRDESQSCATVNGPPTLYCGIPNGFVGESYTHTYTATGGTPPYTYSIASGALPSGWSLSAAGVLSGTATVAGSYSFAVIVTDSLGAVAGCGGWSGQEGEGPPPETEISVSSPFLGTLSGIESKTRPLSYDAQWQLPADIPVGSEIDSATRFGNDVFIVGGGSCWFSPASSLSGWLAGPSGATTSGVFSGNIAVIGGKLWLPAGIGQLKYITSWADAAFQTVSDFGSREMVAVAEANGVTVAVSRTGQIYNSANNLSFSLVNDIYLPAGLVSPVDCMASNGSRIAIIGYRYAPVVEYSDDAGGVFSSATFPATGSPVPQVIRWAGGSRWLVGCNIASADTGLFMSTDGCANFAPVTLPVQLSIGRGQIAVHKGRCVVFGTQKGTSTTRAFWTDDYTNWNEISFVPSVATEPTTVKNIWNIAGPEVL
jgi:hypothetical protein